MNTNHNNELDSVQREEGNLISRAVKKVGWAFLSLCATYPLVVLCILFFAIILALSTIGDQQRWIHL